MIAEDLYAAIKTLPKIELHRHLEGSVRLATLVDIARQYHLAIPNYEPETLRPFVQVMPNDPWTPQNFLGKFYVLRQFYCSVEVIERITYEVVEDAALDNVRYMELRFTPRALCNITECTYAEIVPIVCDIATQAAARFGIQVRLIVSMNRHESVALGEMTLNAALDNVDRGVVGLDLAGDEVHFRALPFRDIFRRAKAAGLGLTIHGGEWGGVENVWDAVGNLGADRVGHGVKALEDAGIMQVLVDRGITLEVCPSSNLYSNVARSLEEHPLPLLTQNQVLTTINTDDPAVCNITLSDEIWRSMQYMGMTFADIKAATVRAAQAAFLSDSERAELVNQFEDWLATV